MPLQKYSAARALWKLQICVDCVNNMWTASEQLKYELYIQTKEKKARAYARISCAYEEYEREPRRCEAAAKRTQKAFCLEKYSRCFATPYFSKPPHLMSSSEGVAIYIVATLLINQPC